MNDTAKIDKAKREDVDEVVRVTRETIEAVYPSFYSKGVVDFFLAHHKIEAVKRDVEAGVVYVLREAGKVVGTVTLNDCEINRLFVLPEHQGKGYGGMLMDFAEQHLFERCGAIRLSASRPSEGLYLMRGYEVVDSREIKTDSGDVLHYEYMEKKNRCSWPGTDPLYIDYHDNEWGRPLHDDTKLFELLILEGAQAGLSWITVLKKREAYRKAFDGFDPHLVAQYDEAKVEELMANEGIIRNRLKINSAITNAQCFLKVVDEYGSFDNYIWSYVGGVPLVNRCAKTEDIPATTPLSDQISKDLKKRGFKFVGSTIVYAYMQSIGMVNDHLVTCFAYGDCSA